MLKDEHSERLANASRLADKGELDEAWKIASDHLTNVDPNDARALVIATVCHEQSRHYAEAYQFAKRALEVAPDKARAWANMGRLEEALYRFEPADNCYRKALRMTPNPVLQVPILNNWAAMLCQRGDYIAAEEVARRALAIEPDHKKAQGNLGICLLAKGQWEEGWKFYDAIIGFGEQRKRIQYAEEPLWDGSPGKTLAIYGEQGLGDEISFASMVPDAIKVCKKVILDCDARLEKLYARSFPQARVYGTRAAKVLEWNLDDRTVDASVSAGGIGKYFRPRPDTCPGTPYLVADPDRVLMWKSLWKTKGKPAIGIAWTGGMQWTGAKFRKWKLDALKPIFESVDAHWVVLEYRDRGGEVEEFRNRTGIDIRQYPYATLSKDYDDTAALVASLDRVVCMQTAVVHLAGALGIPADCFVHKHNQWRYGLKGESIPWYNCVRLWRQKQNGYWPIDECAAELRKRYCVAVAA